MLSGGQEFVLVIIGMGMFAGVAKTSIAAKHGLPWGGRRSERGLRIPLPHENAEVDTLRRENKRLTDQVETMQDRLVVLEKIVTDRGYGLAAEIEALRDRKDPREREVQ